MKTLIFALILSLPASATEPGEMRLSDPEINQKLVTVARDVQNENILKDITQLQDCRNEFQRTGKPDDPAAMARLETCLKEKIGTGSNATELAKKLDLETYKLIPSPTVQNVTKYLTKKLYLELTGIDIDETDPEKIIRSQKFSNKKQVDHKNFFALYKNQIAKNALYEVSRFCFVDLRKIPPANSPTPPAKTFMEHWGNLREFSNRVDISGSNNPIPVKDDGSPAFEDSSMTSSNDTKSSYRNIMRNIFGNTTQPPSEKNFENFFFFCGQQINKLCSTYEERCKSSNVSGQRNCGGTTTGAKACLAKTRLTAFRTAMKASDKIVEEFENENGSSIALKLNPNEIVKRYQGGEGNEKSLNELTNSASIDFYKANESANSEASECIASNGADCEKFEIVDDSVARIQTNNTIVYEAKRLAEMERIKDMVSRRDKDLEEYIEQYYPDLKEMLETNPSGLEAAISAKWDARREALEKEIQSRIGSRQITEAVASDTNVSDSRFANKGQETAVRNAEETLSEKTRLAQVVFFNNIISSTLLLKDASGKELGRNVQALNNEIAAAENEVDDGLFDNLKGLGRTTSGSSSGSSGGQLTGNESVTNIDFLDEFIGIPKSP